MPQQQQGAVDGAAAQGQGANAPRQGGGFLSTLVRMAFFWWFMNYMKSGNRGPSGPQLTNLFQRGEPIDITVHIDESPKFHQGFLDNEPVWHVEAIELVTSETRSKNITYKVPESAKNNGSLYLHVLVTREGYEYLAHNAFHSVVPLTHYGPKRKEIKEKNLLFEEGKQTQTAQKEEEEESKEIVNYWKPMMTIALVDDFTKYTTKTIPPHLRPLFQLDPEADYYYPMLYFNEFWLLKKNMIELNQTVDEVEIELTVSSIKPWLIQLITQLEESFKLQASMGLNSDEETDEFKKILVEGNPILLGVTFVVSMLHSVFDFLAFKNDIGFWKDNRSMEGLSARSILINAGCQLVIFLYLLDNETSFVVLISAGVGMLIEFWKVTKAMKVTLQWRHGIPLPHFEDRASYSDSETKKHDAVAMKYLSYVIYPLVIGYSIYALINESHKSWYSWILSSLVGAVYAFGFILMCPQLYLNYKLKSVAHLPWRQLTYKFLNTIIDDLFAFVIKMPWLHRLSVFRDDLVFAIYLYQWYIYGVDKTRVNEFGFSENRPQPEGESTPMETIQEENVGSEETTSDGAVDGTNDVSGLVRRKNKAEEKNEANQSSEETHADEETKKDQ